MAFKDYEDLDVTRETISKKELKRLERKYGVNCQYDIRKLIVCLAITLILTIATIVLYCNIIKLSIDLIVGLSMAYFFVFSIIVISIYLAIHKSNIKENVCLAVLGVDALIWMISLIIANMLPIGGTLRMILPIIGVTTFILFLVLLYILNRIQQKK